MSLHRQVFHAEDLVKVSNPQNPVMLKSGGSIMEAESDNNGQVLCSWKTDGKLCRAVFDEACLFKLVSY